MFLEKYHHTRGFRFHTNSPGGRHIEKMLNYEQNSMILTMMLQFDPLNPTKQHKMGNWN